MAKATHKQMIAATALWQAWKDAGNEPATREASLKIIARELRKSGNIAKLDEIRKGQARSIMNGEDQEELAGALSFIVWDLTVNEFECMDYSLGANYFDGLLQQARNLIFTYTRVPIEHPAGKISMPTYVSRPQVGTRKVTKLKQEDLQDIIDKFIQEASDRIARWRFIGANTRMVKTALRAIERQALAEYAAAVEAVA